MLEELFKKFLALSEEMRKGYISSLGKSDNDYLQKLGDTKIELLKIIYKNVSGTHYEIEDQKYMDFLPGFLLIHIDEYTKQKDNLSKIIGKGGSSFFPILVNYSSDYYAIKASATGDDLGIFMINHDESEQILVYKSAKYFLETICANYTEKVYDLDDDDYLNMDFDKEYEIARSINPGISFWEDEE